MAVKNIPVTIHVVGAGVKFIPKTRNITVVNSPPKK